jgi:uncharacterized damage-inducible protein DinB
MELKTHARKELADALGAFEQDLQALPEEAFAHAFGGKSRKVCDIVHEIVLVNDKICQLLRGETVDSWPDSWVVAPEELRGKEASMAAFQAGRDRALATVDGLSEDQMLEPMPSQNGETNRFRRCQFMILHIWYHSGQLNFIQTLLGDDGWHWS